MKRFMGIFLTILAILLLASFVVFSQSKFGQLPKGARLERIKQSPNYQDGEFKNQSPTTTFTGDSNKFKAIVKFLFGKKNRVAPIDPIPSVKTNLKDLAFDQNAMIWFGHSSYFIQLDGKKILVDPVLSGHASPFSWMISAFEGADIYKPEDIPEIDYLIITHDHWDHLDYKTILSLKSRVGKVICGLGVGAHLEYWGIDPKKIVELDWFEQSTLDSSGWKINATPARHFSGRSLKANQTLWASFVLQSPTMRIFIGGDGGYDKHFARIGEEFGPFDLAILEQGQYDTRWKYIHMLPEEVFQAAADLKAKRFIPVHNSKFALGAHPWNEPLVKLAENSKNNSIAVATPRIGEPLYLKDTTQVFSSWWVGVR